MAKQAKAAKRGNAVVPIIVAVLVLLLGSWMIKTFLLDGGTPKNILLLGVDDDKTRTDVVLVAHINPGEGLASLISIPRDTLVEIDCSGLSEGCLSPDKVNHAHAYGGSEDGPQVTLRAVQKFLGIKLDGYVRVDFDGFAQLVDSLGGVEIMIEQEMYYVDPTAGKELTINFKASDKPQLLGGKDALKYVRYRSDGQGDIGRTERTRAFLGALLKTVQQNGKASQLPSMVSGMWPYVKTDLSASTVAALARVAPKLDPGDIQMAMVPGDAVILKDGRWVWQADAEKLQALVDSMIQNPQPKKAAE